LSGDNDRAFTRLIRKACEIGRRLAAVDVQAQLFATAEGDWSQPVLIRPDFLPETTFSLQNSLNCLIFSS
jgi:hypothetical protein